MSAFRLAWLNLVRQPTSSMIAVIAIALSIACSGVLLRLDLASEKRFATIGAGGDALVGAKAGDIQILLGALNGESRDPGFLPYKLFQTLEAQQGVQFEDGEKTQATFIESIIPILEFARYQPTESVEPAHVIGTSEKFFDRSLASDRMEFAEGHGSPESDQIVLGAAIAARDRLKLGDTVRVYVRAGGAVPLSDSVSRILEFKVSGILKPVGTTWDRELYTSVENGQRALSLLDLKSRSIWGASVLNYFIVYLKPGGASALEALVNRRTVGQVVMVDDAKLELRELTSTGRELGFYVTVITLMLGALAVAAMLITRFDAMSLQIAVLRAIGYRTSMIAQWLLWEGLILGVSACAIGGSLDAVFFPLVRQSLGSALPQNDLVSIPIYLSLPVWGAALIATISSVAIPLLRVYRQDVHYSLRD